MRLPNRIPRRTRLLALIAVCSVGIWAGVVWLVRWPAQLPPPLPEKRDNDRPAMPGPNEPAPALDRYAALEERPPFFVERTHRPFNPGKQAQTQARAAATFEYQVTSTANLVGGQVALVRGAGGESITVRVGQPFEPDPAWTLASLDTKAAVFEGPDGPVTVPITRGEVTGAPPPLPIRPVNSMVASAQDQQGHEVSESAPPAAAPPLAPPPPVTIHPDAESDALRARIEARRRELSRPPAPRRER